MRNLRGFATLLSLVLAVLAVGVVAALAEHGLYRGGTRPKARSGRVNDTGSLDVRALAAGSTTPRPVSGMLIAIGKPFGDSTMNVRLSGVRGFVTAEYRFPPGSASPWHSHPVPLLMAVAAGKLTVYYSAAGRCVRTTYPQGEGFIEPPGRIHLVRNETQHVALAIASYIGVSRRLMATLAIATLHNRPSACPQDLR